MATNSSLSESAQDQAAITGLAAMPSSQPSFESLGIRNTTVNEAPDVQLSPLQKLIVGSILDLFEGNPTLKHFTLWSPDGVFEDPMTHSMGEARYKAQWYGLPALFHPIELQSHRVVGAGNPIQLEISNKYVVRGISKQHVINSIVNVHLGDDGKIVKVQDRWNDKLPAGIIADMFRKLNAATVPIFVKVPKTEEEDLKMKAARDNETQQKKKNEQQKA